jgi:hypothetical protein
MLKFDKADIEFIRKYIENPEELLQTDSLSYVLEKIDEIIITKGFDDNYDLTDLGRKAQRVYDNVYENNEIDE